MKEICSCGCAEIIWAGPYEKWAGSPHCRDCGKCIKMASFEEIAWLRENSPESETSGKPARRIEENRKITVRAGTMRCEEEGQAQGHHRTGSDIEVVRTHADKGKSGLRLDGRDALKRLIRDVESGEAAFDAILVYDVSRCGRCQDAGESAH